MFVSSDHVRHLLLAAPTTCESRAEPRIIMSHFEIEERPMHLCALFDSYT